MTGARPAGLILVLPLYLAMATALGFVDYHVRPHGNDGFTVYVPSVIAGKEAPPGRYRILAPYAYAALTKATGLSPVYGWLLFRWLCLVAALAAGDVLLRTWFAPGAAVAGNALTMALLPLTFTNGWPNPDQFTELVLFTLACACLARGWLPAFLVTLALNALNRETLVFLVLLAALAAPLSRRYAVWLAAAAAIWAGIYVSLRLVLGFVSYQAWNLRANLAWLVPLPAGFVGYQRIYGWFFLILLVPLFWLSLASYRDQPRLLRAASAVVAPALLVTGFLFSSVIESRIFTPMFPLLVPGVLWTLFEGARPAAR